MERLTEKIVCNLPDEVLEKLGIADIPKEDYEIKGTNGELCRETCEKYECDSCPIRKAIEKLADYEDAEEQGLLLRLPCKVGDTVWDIDYSRPCAYTITGYSFGIAEDYIDEPVKEDEIVYYYTNSIGSIVGSFASSEIGKTVFLTKEKAEQALAEMKGV